MKILALPYELNWSVGFSLQDLAKAMAGRHEITVRTCPPVLGPQLAEQWDVILVGDAYQRVRISRELWRKTIAGVRSFVDFGLNPKIHASWIRRIRPYRTVGCLDPRTISTIAHYRPRVLWTPPGVSSMFSPPLSPEVMPSGKLRVGWAGNPAWGGRLDVKRFRMVEDAVRRLGARAELKVARKLPRKGMPDFYRSLDVLVVTSRSETGPLPLLEALCCGIPVVTTDVGLAPIHVRHGVNGWFYDGTPLGLRWILGKLAAEPKTIFAAKLAASRPAPLMRWPDVLPYWETFFSCATLPV